MTKLCIAGGEILFGRDYINATLKRDELRAPDSKRSILWQVTWRERWALAGLTALCMLGVVGSLLTPILQKVFFDRVANPSSSILGLTGFQDWGLTAIAFLFGLNFIVFRFVDFASGRASQHITSRIQRYAGERLYRKSMSVKSQDLQGYGTGEIVTLYAVDVPGMSLQFEMNIPIFLNTVFAVILAPLTLVWLYDFPLWPLIVTQVLSVIVISFFSVRQSRLFTRFKVLAGERLNLINEWIQNIRMLRLMSWIPHYEQRILEKRREETANRVTMVTNGQILATFGSSVNFLFNTVTIASFVWSGANLQAGDLFVVMWIVGITLGRVYRGLPWMLTFWVDAATSAGRIDRFLALEERGQSMTSLGPGAEFAPGTKSSSPLAMSVRNLNLSIGSQTILKNISFDIPKGALITIVGEVGSGKTSLLLSLLGENGASFSEFSLFGRPVESLSVRERRDEIAYVPQDLFVASSTVRDNVWLAFQSDAQKDSEVLEALSRAEFRVDQEGLGAGLDTTLGERGVNLSGGQKQRLMLARADIFDRPIVLFDDAMSAVDVATENALRRELIAGAWKHKTRIVATHRLSLLEDADHILFLENGELVAQGKLSDLRGHPRFDNFERTHRQSQTAEPEVRP